MAKKNFIGLSILLLVLLLGLSTTSYALTETEYKNVCYNYLVNKLSYTSESAINKVDSYDLTNVRPYFDNSAYGFFIFTLSNTSQDLYLNIVKKDGYSTNGSNEDYCVWCGSGSTWKIGRYVRYKYNKISTNGNYDSTLTDMWSTTVGINTFGTEFDIWGITSQYDSTRKKWYPAGTWSSVLSKEGPYVDDYFVYSYNSELTDIQVPNIYSPNELTTIKSMTYNDFVGEYVAAVGMLKYLDYIQVTQVYWDNSISDWKLYRYNDNYIKNNDFESEEPIEVKCPSGWWVGNTIIKFTCNPTWGNNVGDILEFWVYLVDNNTIINNGVLQIGTFSGDYNNNMQNDLNNQLADERTQEIINTITDDSKVDSMLGDFASGDIGEKMGYVEHSLPNVPDERNPSLLVMNLVNDFCDILIDDDNPYWDYSMHGETPTRIYASDFVTEETPLKVFIRLSMIFGSLFLIYIQFKHIIELINEGNAPKVLHDIDADVYFYKM